MTPPDQADYSPAAGMLREVRELRSDIRDMRVDIKDMRRDVDRRLEAMDSRYASRREFEELSALVKASKATWWQILTVVLMSVTTVVAVLAWARTTGGV